MAGWKCVEQIAVAVVWLFSREEDLDGFRRFSFIISGTAHFGGWSQWSQCLGVDWVRRKDVAGVRGWENRTEINAYRDDTCALWLIN